MNPTPPPEPRAPRTLAGWILWLALGPENLDRLGKLVLLEDRMDHAARCWLMLCGTDFGRGGLPHFEQHQRMADEFDRLRFWWMRRAPRLPEPEWDSAASRSPR